MNVEIYIETLKPCTGFRRLFISQGKPVSVDLDKPVKMVLQIKQKYFVNFLYFSTNPTYNISYNSSLTLTITKSI